MKANIEMEKALSNNSLFSNERYEDNKGIKQEKADKLAGLKENKKFIYDNISYKKNKSIFHILSIRYHKTNFRKKI